jgi:hypothetical protein
MIQISVFCTLGVLILVLLFFWMLHRVRYRIGSRHIKVILFGVPLRRLAIDSIESVSKRRGDGWAENWWSTTRPKHRLLVLRRRSGLFRNFIITPKNRYIFKTDIERAMRRIAARATAGTSASADSDREPSDHETVPTGSDSDSNQDLDSSQEGV